MRKTKGANLMKKGISAIALLFVFGVCAAKVQAEPITINLTATVNFVNGADILDNKIYVGSIITGSYTYESTTPDTNPAIDVGDYWHYSTPAGIFLSVGGFEFKTDSTNINFLASIGNNHSGRDVYLVRRYNNLPLSDTVSVGSISWQLDDYTATAFSSDALPATAPILSQWQDNDLMIDGGGGYSIHANVTSAELVPEPGTLLLLTLGAFAIRRRQHFQN